MTDLSAEELTGPLDGRPARVYPALLSTSADAQAWARAGAPDGAVVVAGYQASPRGRAGWPWELDAERDLCFSLVVHPGLSAEREGWLYLAAIAGVADALAAGELHWPDEVWHDGRLTGAVGVESELDPGGLTWAVINVWLRDIAAPRGVVLARTAEAIEARLADEPDTVLAVVTARCATLGQRIRARLIPLGPGGPEVMGEATTCLADGALVVTTDRATRVAVRPQHLGIIERDIDVALDARLLPDLDLNAPRRPPIDPEPR